MAATVTGSLEGGYPFHFKNDWRLEPQAQLVYHHAYKADGFDAGGAVRFDGQDSLIGRLGLRLAQTWDRADEGEEARRTTARVRLDLWHEFLDRPSIGFATEDGPVSFTSDTGTDWLKLGGSLTRQMSRKSTLFGDLGYAWDLEDNGHAWTAKLGMRFNW